LRHNVNLFIGPRVNYKMIYTLTTDRIVSVPSKNSLKLEVRNTKQ